jgi:predicted negative regulator of RcsB-dependent stress response
MEFFEKNGKLVVGAFFALIVIGLVATFVSSGSKRNEEKAQEKLAQIEIEYTKYKESVAKSSTPPSPVKDDKKSAADKKAEEKALADSSAQVVQLRTQLTTSLNQFLTENKKSIATEMAALYLSELLIDENKNAEALEVLKKTESSSNDLTSVLVQKKIGSLLADNNQCEDALKVWDKLLKSSTAKFAHSEVKIMQSLCYQKMNDLKKAEEILLSVKNDKTEGSADYVQHAERILRLIQFKKASGT